MPSAELARAASATVFQHARPEVVVMAVGEFLRLSADALSRTAKRRVGC